MRFLRALVALAVPLVPVACRTPHAAATVKDAETAPMAPTALFAQVCANSGNTSQDAVKVMTALRTGPAEATVVSPDSIVEFETSGTCQQVWDRFVKTPYASIPVLADLAPLAMLQGVPGLRLDLTIDKMPAHVAVLESLDLVHLSLTSSVEGPAALSQADGKQLIAVLSHLANLSYLALHGVGPFDMAPLKALAKLDNFTCSAVGLTDVTFLADWPSVTRLFLNNNQIEDLKPLAGLLQLVQLDLARNRVKSLDVIATLANIETLNLDGNPTIEGLLALAEFPNLNFLSVENAGIKNIEPLHKLPLSYLNLQDNPIETIEPLRNLPLRQLFIRRSNVSDLDPIRDMKQLFLLNAAGTKATSFPKLGPGAALSTVDLQGTHVTDLCNVLEPKALLNLRTPQGAIWTKNAIAQHRCH